MRKYAFFILILTLLFCGAVLADGVQMEMPQSTVPAPDDGFPVPPDAVPQRTHAPTPSPVPQRTHAPTPSPVPERTHAPTPSPTPERTHAPTPSPTAKPTAKPTTKTTEKPMEKPIDMRSPSDDIKKPIVALTFDDGPSAATKRILAALKEAGGKATFFMVGERVADYPNTAKAVAAQGNQIGTHSWSHNSLTKMDADAIRDDLRRSMDAIESVTGVRPIALRPPYGNVNSVVKRVCGELDLVVVNWGLDTLDWKTRDADSVYNEVMTNVRDGAIVLCHDLYESTVDAMVRVIPELVKRGYRLVTVTELLDAKSPGWKPGQLYYGTQTK